MHDLSNDQDALTLTVEEAQETLLGLLESRAKGIMQNVKADAMEGRDDRILEASERLLRCSFCFCFCFDRAASIVVAFSKYFMIIVRPLGGNRLCIICNICSVGNTRKYALNALEMHYDYTS